MTPNPQPNTLDEILRPWLEEAQSEYGTGHNDHKKRAFIEIETAKQQIQALITEARIDELLKVRPRDWKAYDGSDKSDEELGFQKGIHAQINITQKEIDDRLTQLRENN